MLRTVQEPEAIRGHARALATEATTPMVLLIDSTADGVCLEGSTDALPLYLDVSRAEASMLDDDDGITVLHMVTVSGAAEAWIPWSAVFAVVSPAIASRGGQRVITVRTDAVPAHVVAQGNPMAGVALLVAQLGLDRSAIAELRPFRTDLPRGYVEQLAPEAFRSDKREALIELLDKVDPDPIYVLLDPSVPGTQTPSPPPADSTTVTAIDLGRHPPFQDLRILGVEVRYKTRRPDFSRATVRLPWSSIAAIQHPGTLEGWFWPRDLPEPMRRRIEQSPDTLGHLLALDGVPFVSAAQVLDRGGPGPPVTRLRRAPEASVQQAVRVALERGGSLAFVNPAHPRVKLPEELARQSIVAVPLAGMGAEPLEPAVGAFDLKLQMPSPAGGLAEVVLPWDAIFAVTADGDLRVSHYPAVWPDAMWRAVDVRSHMAEHGGLPDSLPEGVQAAAPGDDAPNGELCLGTVEDGRVMMGLRQPMGPPTPSGDRMILELVFALDDLPSWHELEDVQPASRSPTT